MCSPINVSQLATHPVQIKLHPDQMKKLARRWTGYDPKVHTSDQYLICTIQDEEPLFYFEDDSGYPQLAGLDTDLNVRFRVFGKEDLNTVLTILQYSSVHYRMELQVYSLFNLGYEPA